MLEIIRKCEKRIKEIQNKRLNYTEVYSIKEAFALYLLAVQNVEKEKN